MHITISLLSLVALAAAHGLGRGGAHAEHAGVAKRAVEVSWDAAGDGKSAGIGS